MPYRKWREYNPEDTVRFYALRLHEVGMIKSTPQKLIAQGTDWRFLNELKRELKVSKLPTIAFPASRSIKSGFLHCAHCTRGGSGQAEVATTAQETTRWTD